MTIKDLQEKKVGILGFGLEGQSTAKFLDKHGIKYTVYDRDQNPEYLEQAVKNCEILFRSPGIKLTEPALIAAKKNGVEITSQIKFFFENCTSKNIIGVTGTKGKGTTSQLIYNMLELAGQKAYLVGNIGKPAIDVLGQVQADDFVVVELSSFQLQDLENSPHIAVVLMVVPEHLDYHLDLGEYVQAKMNILKYQKKEDFAVINCDYDLSVKIGKEGSAQKTYIQTLPKTATGENDPFKIYKPEEYLKIEEGVFVEELHGGIYSVEHGHLRKVMETSDATLRGFHNTENIAAAIQVAKILGLKENLVIEAVKNYKGLEHRLEFVAEKNQVKFYNDSIGTTPESSLAAIHSFSEPVIAIIGGADKKADYQKFVTDLCKAKNLKALCLLGEIAGQLEQGLKEFGFSGRLLTGAKNMSEAFEQTVEIAEPGDVILLAPGTSSFDMFKDYKDRGNQFKQAVNAWH